MQCFQDENEDLKDILSTKFKRLKRRKSGGFQSMGLSSPIYKGIVKKGYKIPTPIQRKCIPFILEGRDIVAMARTGSGKTACFLIPMFEKLQNRATKSGARALIISPTRELALQTLKFSKELGKYTNLQIALILGGDSISEQFEALHCNPDILIATPGRLMHVCVEMNLQLKSIEYVVFDEADKLFEMGFANQLEEIFHRLPQKRQTLLFSATLPKILVSFVKAGLSNPMLIRLDVDTKLSEQLKLVFLTCCQKDKIGVLLYLLANIIKKQEQTLIFVATKYDVEYLHMLLEVAGFPNSYIFSSLDQVARNFNLEKFKNKELSLLVVTDIAARGIDIPLLDNVINYNFPAKAKLFVHRVGRVARAGRSGYAYSLVSPDELPYILDLYLFLGKPLKNENIDSEDVIGSVPQHVIDDTMERIQKWLYINYDLQSLTNIAEKGYKHYIKSRIPPSVESINRSKKLNALNFPVHRILQNDNFDNEEDTKQLLQKIKNYRPHLTIFEVSRMGNLKSVEIMKAKRNMHEKSIVTHKREIENNEHNKNLSTKMTLLPNSNVETEKVFNTIIVGKPPSNKIFFQCPSHDKIQIYIPYQPPDYKTEHELLVNNFDKEIRKVTMDLTVDEIDQMKSQKNYLRWDRKHKKFIQSGDNFTKKIKTESGVWIPASYKKDLYDQWIKKKRRLNKPKILDDENKIQSSSKERNKRFKFSSLQKKNVRKEVKSVEQIIKKRKLKLRQKTRNKKKQNRNKTCK